MKAVHRVHVTGPLASYAKGFAASLARQGYAELSLRNQLRLVAHFSQWLEAKRIGVPLRAAATTSSCFAHARLTRPAPHDLGWLQLLSDIATHARRLALDRR
jgi:hypothetical protein